MLFEYDENKSMSNKQKHGIDFEEAKLLWDDVNLVEIDVAYEGEPRYVAIGTIGKKHWSVVITHREEIIRIISARCSREKEVDIYDQDNNN